MGWLFLLFQFVQGNDDENETKNICGPIEERVQKPIIKQNPRGSTEHLVCKAKEWNDEWKNSKN